MEPKMARDGAWNLLDRVGLAQKATYFPNWLSGGQKATSWPLPRAPWPMKPKGNVFE